MPKRFSIRALLLLMALIAVGIVIVQYRLHERNREIYVLNQHFAEPDVQPLQWGGTAPPSADTEIGISGTTSHGHAFVATVQPQSDSLWQAGKLVGTNLTNSRIVALELDGAMQREDTDKLAMFPSLESLTLTNSQLTDDGLISLARLTQLKRITIINSEGITDGMERLSAIRPDIRLTRIAK